MKTEKYILSVFCVAACVLTATMVVGVIALAQHQGAISLFALFEVVAFALAGVIPLVFSWLPREKKRKWLFIVWTLCTAYVALLAANALRLGLFGLGASRLALWAIIAVLFIRIFTHDAKRA